MQSPYHPGTGSRPEVLVGRDTIFNQAQATLERVRSTRRGASTALVLVGVRGSGKTVSLDVIGERATAAGFVVASTTFSSVTEAPQDVAGAVAEAISPFQKPGSQQWERVRQWLSGLQVEINAGVVKVSGRSAGGGRSAGEAPGVAAALGDLLADAGVLAVGRKSSGLVLLIDEIQEASPRDLTVVANALQRTVRGGQPVAVFAAGLPRASGKLMEAASFTERFDYRELGRLSREESAVALLQPASKLEVRWAEPAIELALDFAAGSPYMIQKSGDEAWMAASPRRGDEISIRHAASAISEIVASHASGMFKGRLEKATPAEREMIIAIAQCLDPTGGARTSDVGARLGKSSPQMSRDRQALIDKGLVESLGYGRVGFTMPGFREYVLGVVDDAALIGGVDQPWRLGAPRPAIPDEPPPGVGAGPGTEG